MWKQNVLDYHHVYQSISKTYFGVTNTKEITFNSFIAMRLIEHDLNRALGKNMSIICLTVKHCRRLICTFNFNFWQSLQWQWGSLYQLLGNRHSIFKVPQEHVGHIQKIKYLMIFSMPYETTGCCTCTLVRICRANFPINWLGQCYCNLLYEVNLNWSWF